MAMTHESSYTLLRLLSRVAAILGRPGARRTHEQFLAVGERQVAAVCPARSIQSAVAVDDDFGAGRQRALRETAPKQRIRRTAFNHPARDAIWRFHIDVGTRQRIDPP